MNTVKVDMQIDEHELKIIRHCKKINIIQQKWTMYKKDAKNKFNVTMGCYDEFGNLQKYLK